MQKVIFLILFFPVLCFSEYFLIFDYRFTEYDFMVDLIPTGKNKILRLDCQSFLHELRVYNDVVDYDHLEHIFPINTDNCLPIANYLINNVGDGKYLCLIADYESGDLLVSHDVQFCFDKD